MKLREIEFGNVLSASGVQGFFGEGYWFHPLLKPIGLNFDGMTFVSKTATLLSRKGNAPLTRTYGLREWFPKCIKVKPHRNVMLNAVGLSNPGLGALLGDGRWQKRTEPFLISIMPVATTRAKRADELRILMELLSYAQEEMNTPIGIQLNLSCPNTGEEPKVMIEEQADQLDICGSFGFATMAKYSIASAPIAAIAELEDHPHCDAICVSNTLPFGWVGLDWKKVWGSAHSPLEQLGGGGLSGAPLRPLVCFWIARLRERGFTKPINGGGGILNYNDIDAYNRAGASSIFLGSIATLRPWRVKKMINYANTLDWR